MLKNLISRTAAADYLGISLTTIDRMIQDGDLPYYKIRGRIRFDTVDLEAYVDSCRRQNQPIATPRFKRKTQRDYSSQVCEYVPGMKVV